MVTQSTARSSSWVPHYVAIVDVRPALTYIQGVRALDVLSERIGVERLLKEVMWDGFYGRPAQTLEFLYEHQDEIESHGDICVDDLFGPMQGLEEYLSTDFLSCLTQEKRDAFREEGFVFAAWSAPAYAVITSTSGAKYPSGSPAARQYWGVIDSMDVDPGLDDYYQSRRGQRRPTPIIGTHRSTGARRLSRN